MPFNDYSDSGLEGEPSAEWYLGELARSGSLPTGRSKTWSMDTLHGGDRTAHEHYVLSKVLELAAGVDQLNLFTLVCFEVVCRGLQLIEHAYASKPANPDYSMSGFFIGFSSARSGALVAPAVSKHAAEKAKERAATLKESRKFL